MALIYTVEPSKVHHRCLKVTRTLHLLTNYDTDDMPCYSKEEGCTCVM